MGIEITLITGPDLIPEWFYSYSAVAYFFSFLISLLISFYSFKLYKKTKSPLNLILMAAFVTLSIAFASLLATSLYTFFYNSYFTSYGNLHLVNYYGYRLYYITSVISYLLILSIYLPKKIRNKFFMVYVPLYYTDLASFHFLSIVLLAYVVAKNISNFYKKRNLDSFLVMAAFAIIIVFHLMQLLVSFNVELYLLSHALLVIGFGSLLTMLIRVSRR